MAAAKEDKEEWVSITAKALDNFTAPLDLTAVMSSSSVVTYLLSVLAPADQIFISDANCGCSWLSVDCNPGNCFLPDGDSF
jgi:hypothetical protein